MIRSLSFDNILNKKYEYIPFSKDFMDAFGKRQKSGAWIVYGKSGQGKTSFTFQPGSLTVSATRCCSFPLRWVSSPISGTPCSDS